MEIKKLEKKYVDDVYEIEKACFTSPWSIEDIEAQLSIDTSYFYVAVENDKAVGYIGLQIFSKEGYITNVAVLPENRGNGVAISLLEKAMKNDINFISLEVRQSNAPAIKLYEKVGFKNIGIRPGFYENPKENAIIMTKYFTENV